MEYDMEEYLHGRCDEYIGIIYKDGDIIISLIEYDENIEKDCLLHSFIKRENKYIDASGEMNSFDEVLDNFDYGEFEIIEHNTIDSFNNFINEILT